jgi:hypothetical protein
VIINNNSSFHLVALFIEFIAQEEEEGKSLSLTLSSRVGTGVLNVYDCA